MEEGEVVEDVAFDAPGFRLGVQRLQFGGDLADGAAAVAALDDLEAWAAQAKGALGHEERPRGAGFVVQAAAGSEARLGIEIGSHPWKPGGDGQQKRR